MDERLAGEVAAAAGDDAVVPAAELAAYAADSSGAPSAHPAAAVRPNDAEGVARVLAAASRLRVPIVPAGARTGLSGGANADRATVVLSLERLTAIDPVDAPNLRLTAGAGARTADVQAAALAAGLFYPPDPASLDRSTIGGNVATNAGGPRCFKYGVTAEYVLALQAVTADGRIFRTGAATRKNTAGPRLAQLLVGSEGTLAVVTEATLRLVAVPTARLAAAARFSSVERAGEAVAAVVASGLVPSALELLDRTCLELIGVPPAEAMLLVEVDGPDAARVREELELVARVLRDAGAEGLETADDPEAVDELWRARRALSPAFASAAPDSLFQDVCVPPGAIPEALRRIGAVAERHGLAIPVFGHAGDGNLHPTVLYDAAAGRSEAAHAAEAGVLRVALELGGTISAEHGVGLLKRPFLAEAVDPVALDLMRAVKTALDPLGILNPGKVLP
jgi:glycolate dehydrogenase FAD-linked subunit